MQFNWSDIAKELKINEKTLRQWRTRIGYNDPWEVVYDERLDGLIQDFISTHPNVGRIQLMSFLNTSGYHCTYANLIDSMHRVDSEGCEHRRRKILKRRVYEVEGPNHLWHVDGNHKLRSFNIVVHAGIDGFTRICVFIRCADNNKASTAFTAFQRGIDQYGIPARLRTDRGGENITIGAYMIASRGYNEFLTEPSTRNQRIERFWRDVTRTVLNYYHILFSFLANNWNCDFDNVHHLYIIHYLFLPCIDEDLQRFREMWNNHKLRTEQSKSPNQLWYMHRELTAFAPALVDEAGYGIDGGDNSDDDEQHEENQAVVEPIRCPLHEDDELIFKNTVVPFELHELEDWARVLRKMDNAFTCLGASECSMIKVLLCAWSSSVVV